MEKPDKLNLDFSTSPTVWKFLKDDSFVVSITATKKYVVKNELPGATIEIIPL